MSGPILAATRWPANADLIVACAELGYLRADWRTLDPTWGRGRWWTKWTPADLVTHDLKLDGVDFRHLPHRDGEFDAVAFDPPYKLNGTPTGDVDERYGVDVVRSWQDRHRLIRDGITECARVLRRDGVLLLKCQDQVCSGHVRWQTDEFTRHAESFGLVKVDRFDLLGGRPQPQGRRQIHARRNTSTLLVFRATANRDQLTLEVAG